MIKASVTYSAGDLNTYATFRRSTKAKDTAGQVVETWADAFTVPAGMITTGGREFYAAQKLNAETTAVFLVRFNRAINVQMRVKQGNQTFEIIPPLNDVNRRHEWLLVSAKEVK